MRLHAVLVKHIHSFCWGCFKTTAKSAAAANVAASLGSPCAIQLTAAASTSPTNNTHIYPSHAQLTRHSSSMSSGLAIAWLHKAAANSAS
jgi:hypothetical protein